MAQTDATTGGGRHQPPTLVPTTSATTRILRRGLYRLLTLDRLPAREAARRLNKAWSTVQGALSFLLENGFIRYQGGEPAPKGAAQFYEPGPRAAAWVAEWVDEDQGRGAGRPATLPVRIHRGGRSLTITSLTADPAGVPGYVKPSFPSGQVIHTFGHVDAERRHWKFQVHVSKKTGKATLQIHPPSIVVKDLATVKEAPQWWDEFVHKEALMWARKAGYGVAEGLEVLKHSAPIEYGIPAPNVPKAGVPGVDRVWKDESGTEGGEVEGQEAQLMADLARAPADIMDLQAHARKADADKATAETRLARAERLLNQVISTVSVGAEATASVAEGLTNVRAALLAGQARTDEGVAARSATARSSPPHPTEFI